MEINAYPPPKERPKSAPAPDIHRRHTRKWSARRQIAARRLNNRCKKKNNRYKTKNKRGRRCIRFRFEPDPIFVSFETKTSAETK